MRPEPIIRDWEPGDGIQCRHAGKAPADMPCGKPVKTSISRRSTRPGGPEIDDRAALCVNHARIGNPPNKIMLAAKKYATEKLVARHWDEYRQYLEQAIADLSTDDSGCGGE